MVNINYLCRDPITLEEKFDFLINKEIALLMEKIKIDFDYQNLNWIKENIKKFLPIKFQNFELHLNYNFLSEKNITGILDFWEGEKICLTWKHEKFSIISVINVFTKVGFYSEMNRETYDCFEVYDLNMNNKDAWDKLAELLSKHIN